MGAVLVALACTLFPVPFWEAMIYYGIGMYFVLTLPWVCLNRESIRRVIRAHNRFVHFFLALLIVTLIVRWATDGKAFPKWAVGALIVGAVASYSVMGYYAVVNFGKWRRGDFRGPNS
jgi:O-antigen/teichoic acid export membrane protein